MMMIAVSDGSCCDHVVEHSLLCCRSVLLRILTEDLAELGHAEKILVIAAVRDACKIREQQGGPHGGLQVCEGCLGALRCRAASP